MTELGRNTTGLDLRKSYYDDVQEIIADDLPDIFLYHRIRINDHNNGFHDFVATPSVLSIDSYSLEKVWYEPTFSGQGKSPVETAIINPEGLRTGYDPTSGMIVEQIPNSSYIRNCKLFELRSPKATKITVRAAGDPYKEMTTIEPSYYTVEVIGNDTGHHRLELVNIALDYKSVIILENDTKPGQVDRYFIVIYTNGIIYRSFYPPPLQITYSLGKQLIIPQDGVDPKSYERKRSNTIVPD